jgi:flavin-binding protein dodecin
MDKTYKKVEVVGTSKESFSEAVRSAVRRGAATIEGITWFEVVELRGSVEDGQVSEYQATVKLGFRVND